MRKIVFLVAVLAFATSVSAQRRRVIRTPPNPVQEIRQLTREITDLVLDSYADEDLRPIWQSIADRPRATENALYAIIPTSRAFALMVRYENSTPADPQLVARAMDTLEISVDSYDDWGRTWASPSVVYTLVLTSFRIAQHTELPADLRGRATTLWNEVAHIAALEADYGLTIPLPPEFDSSQTGDTKAEEFAWSTTHFAAAILANPGHPSVPAWDRRMRQMGYNAITRPSDPPDAEGWKYTTVTEDFRLSNHDLSPNPFYTAATINLLAWSVLAYRLQGLDAPVELMHNVHPLYDVYKTYCSVTPSGEHYWNLPADAGDPTLFPLAVVGDTQRDVRLARARAGRRQLTYPAAVGPVRTEDFYATVENHKIAAYAIFGLYLWYYPTPLPALGPGEVVRGRVQ